ncbi:MAG TPA: AbrB/MazE/SpoVT family DNA-binding domain-containing protein [Rhizomicrobium sp.]|jgi:antitoxin VapB|nr:AbrB/MazE/SpoVT family DNA-binding domain-containing protein [Rhizomicrobium sp.]
MKTRIFKSGNSQAVRIPAGIAFADDNAEVEITRSGNRIIIEPPRGSLREAVAILRSMPKPQTVQLIERTRMRDTLDD